jgi:hypothetical protein
VLDTSGDDQVDITDAVSLLNFLFAGGPAPPVPFPECAPSEPDADGTLSCAEPQC